MSKKFIKLAFVIYIAVLLYLTIFSREMRILYVDFHNEADIESLFWIYTHVPNWQPFDSINLYMNAPSMDFLYNVIGNIIAFIPFTFLGGLSSSEVIQVFYMLLLPLGLLKYPSYFLCVVRLT